MSAVPPEAVTACMLDLFYTRQDVYPRSFITPEGKMGYNPACACSPSCYKGSKCPQWAPVPISEEVILRHLSAQSLQPAPATIGTYCVRPIVNHVRFVCWDVDAHGETTEEMAHEKVRALAAILDRHRLPFCLEHSGGGYHLWLFVGSTATDALKAGGAAVQLAKVTGVEVFPKQSEVREGDYGNLLKLPLGLHYSGKRCLFVSPETFEPYPDQYGFVLEGIKKASPVALQRLVSKYTPPTVRPPLRMLQPSGRTGASSMPAHVAQNPPCFGNMLCASVKEGSRNNVLYQLAIDVKYRLTDDPEQAMEILTPWRLKQQPPMDEDEFRKTIDSAYRSGRGYGCDREATQPYCEAERCPVYHKSHQETSK